MQKTLPLPLVLASGSRYRSELLARLNLPFAAIASGVDETPLLGESPQALVIRLAHLKAATLGLAHPDALIIGSDQIALIDEIMLGKPGHHAAAVAQLGAISGQHVRFLTALCVLNARTQHCQECVVETRVQMRHLNASEIERYLEQEHAYDCAGSAKIEGLGISLIENMDCEDPTALIGLPLIRLCQMLRAEGVCVP
jgi:septum formation protein